MSLYSRIYKINGVEKRITCNPDEMLSTMLRRIGLTGVKVGCGMGQCGACTVLLNGDPVRSCVRKMKTVEELSSIETIEGLGVASNLHPLQRAWIKYGGVQCGFCTPGFIMSAKGLLEVNPNPTRQDVRDWFTKHKNLCRCTGYKPLVDAVMAAAEVMRGEKPLSALDPEHDDNGRIFNSRYARPAALGKVMGATDYGADLGQKMPEGTLEIAVVWSGQRHANILNIDSSEAEKMEGVVAVLTAKDVQGTNDMGWPLDFPRAEAKSHSMPILCATKVRRPGDAVALVVADTEAHARAAVAKVKVEYESLPVYDNYLESCMPDAVPIDEVCPNVMAYQPMMKGEDTRKFFENPEAQGLEIVEGSFSFVQQAHMPIESLHAQAFYDEDDMLTLVYKSQNAHAAVGGLAPALGIPAEKLRCVMAPCGGSFGFSMMNDAAAFVGVAALALHKPVNLRMTYPEFMRNSGKRPAGFINSRLAATKEGKLVALEVDLASDAGSWGAYGLAETQYSVLYAGGMHLNIPNFRGIGRSGLSNQCYGTTYRSFGSPQGYSAYDPLVDMMARKLGIDPYDFRLMNVVHEGDTTPGQIPYPSYRMEKLLKAMKPAWDEAKKWKEATPTEGCKRGIGIALGGFHSANHQDYAETYIELNPDNSVTVKNCYQDVGQGSDVATLSVAAEALAPLNLPIEKIHLYMSDTKYTPPFGPSAGSRGQFMVGFITKDAADKLMNAMRKEDGSFRTYDEMIAENIPVRYTGSFSVPEGNGYTTAAFDPDSGRGQPGPDYQHNVFIVGVEVEEATGKTTVRFSRNGSDVGVISNYLAVEGQVWGGLEHSYGYALSEHYSDGDKKCATMRGCGFPECNDVPDDMTIYFQEEPRNLGPYGTIGCSEGYQSSPHCAVINAIEDAVGVRIYDLPATPDKIKDGMNKIARGENLTPDKFYLGADFYDLIDEIYENPLSGQVRAFGIV